MSSLVDRRTHTHALISKETRHCLRLLYQKAQFVRFIGVQHWQSIFVHLSSCYNKITIYEYIAAVFYMEQNASDTAYGKTFEWENFRGCAQNTLFTGKLLQYIRPWPSCAVHRKWFKGKTFAIDWKTAKNAKVFPLKNFAI